MKNKMTYLNQNVTTDPAWDPVQDRFLLLKCFFFMLIFVLFSNMFSIYIYILFSVSQLPLVAMRRVPPGSVCIEGKVKVEATQILIYCYLYVFCMFSFLFNSGICNLVLKSGISRRFATKTYLRDL